MTTLHEAIAELPAGERATNTTVNYYFHLDGALSEDEVRAEVRSRYPAFRRVEVDHFTDRALDLPPVWKVHVSLRKEW